MTPGAFTSPDLPGQPILRAVDAQTTQLLREYVAGGDQPLLLALKRALPQFIDDITRDYGNDLYERMMRDPDVDSAIETLKLLVISEDITFLPSHQPPGQEETPDPKAIADANRAKEMKEFVERRLKDMSPNMHALAKELLDGLAFGHKAAEKVFKHVVNGPDAGKLGYAAIKCRPRRNLAFVVDAYNNVIGFLAIMPDQYVTALGLQTFIGDPTILPNFMPRDKMVLFQWDVKNGDPRGSSMLRSSYNPWFMKAQVLPEYYKYLKQFATPSVVGMTPELGDGYSPRFNDDGTPMVDANGQPKMMTSEQAMMNSLLGFLNGSVVVVKGGSKVDFVQSSGEGQAFLSAFEYFGRQIHLGVLKTARATKEAQHGSKADSSSAQDVLSLVVGYIKLLLSHVIDEDIIRPLIELNFPDAVQFMPTTSLSKGEKADKAALILAYTAAGWSVHRSQFAGIDREVDAPERDLDEEAADVAHQQDIEKMTAGMNADLFHPAGEELGATDAAKANQNAKKGKSAGGEA